MINADQLKTLGKQNKENEITGTFTCNIFSPYFQKEIKLNFLFSNNVKDENDWNTLTVLINEFIKLDETKIGWIKDILWEMCLNCFEGTDYGFDLNPDTPPLADETLEQIMKFKKHEFMPLDNYIKNVQYFKIFNKEQALLSTNNNHVDFIGDRVNFYFSTVWDDEHDSVICTLKYDLESWS